MRAQNAKPSLKLRVCVCVCVGGGGERVGQQITWSDSTHSPKSISSVLPSKLNRILNMI